MHRRAATTCRALERGGLLADAPCLSPPLVRAQHGDSMLDETYVSSFGKASTGPPGLTLHARGVREQPCRQRCRPRPRLR